MPVAIALIVGVVVLATSIIGFVWTIIFLVPFYGYVGIALYLMFRRRKKQIALDATLEREAEKQRWLNEQEYKAWRGTLD